MSENPIENATMGMGMQMTGLFNPDCGVFLHPLIGGSGVFTPLIEYEIAECLLHPLILTAEWLLHSLNMRLLDWNV